MNIFKIIKYKIFIPPEIKEAKEILTEVSKNFSAEWLGFDRVTKQVKERLFLYPDKFVSEVKQGTSVNQLIYATIGNVAGDLAESGGLFDLACGNFIKIYEKASAELVKIGVIDIKYSEKQKEILKKRVY